MTGPNIIGREHPSAMLVITSLKEENQMNDQCDIQLHFDVRSSCALLSYDGRNYVLPDTYLSKDAAEAAAKKFAWDRLGTRSRQAMKSSDLPVFHR